MNYNVNLNLYKHFYVVAKYNSYTKAATVLMVSQPSLSYSIKMLENHLGKKLFIRSNNKIKLTEDGKIIFDKLSVIFKQFSEIEYKDNEIKGKITLGVRSGYANKILPFYINMINKLYPNLDIEFIVAPSDRLLSLLTNNKIDILIDEYELNGEYNSILHYEDKTVFFTTQNSFDDIKDLGYSINTFKNKKICIVKRNKITRDILDKYPNFNYLILQSTPLMITRIASDNLIGISPKSLIKEELESGKIVEININLPLPNAKLFLSYIKRLENENIKCVIDVFNKYRG